ncbi:MAG: hypothetical protein K2X82_15380 [Gemmataceae bacterium]|nr:hypothetical protein [Gemmataceae bacterium]
MGPAVISLEVDPDTARRYAAAPADEQQKLRLLLLLRLRELTAGPARPLQQVMDDIGRAAEARGLTPEVLEGLLRDD